MNTVLQMLSAWGVILSLMLVLRYRRWLAREWVLAYRHCGENGWGYDRRKYRRENGRLRED